MGASHREHSRCRYEGVSSISWSMSGVKVRVGYGSHGSGGGTVYFPHDGENFPVPHWVNWSVIGGSAELLSCFSFSSGPECSGSLLVGPEGGPDRKRVGSSAAPPGSSIEGLGSVSKGPMGLL